MDNPNFSWRGQERHSLSFPKNIEVLPWAETMRKVNSIIPYVGGKAGLVPLLVPILEWAAKQYKLKSYVEATGGGGRCLLNLDQKLFEHRVYNEIDYPLSCLFHVLRDPYSAADLVTKLYRQNYNQEVCDAAVAARKRDNNLAEQGLFEQASDYLSAAANTVVAACMSRAAQMEEFDGHSKRSRHDGYYQRVLNLEQFVPVLSGVDVIRWDCRKLIKSIEEENEKYPHANCLILVDPPYDEKAMTGNKHYAYSWNRIDHINFRDLIKHTETYMVICGYSSEIYDELCNCGWTKIFLKSKHVSMGGTGRRKNEYIYVNFQIPEEVLAIVSPEIQIIRRSGSIIGFLNH